MLSNNFWKGRKVFLTGHTGFKGTWMCILLNMLGAEVTGYALMPPTNPSMFEIIGASNFLTSIIADIRDVETVKTAMIQAQPEIVIHMAAQPIVRVSYQHPVETYATNVMGTVNIFEAIRSTPSVRVVLNITTDKVYENNECSSGYREIDTLGGYDPYSNSKACSELVTSAFRNSYFNLSNYETHRVAIATVRAGNVIGGGDWASDRIIPDCIRFIMQNQPIIVRSPGAIRPWQHVLDPVVFYLFMCEKLVLDGSAYSSPWNVGPNDDSCLTVGDVVNKFTKLWEGASYKFETDEGPHESGLLRLDNSKAKSILGWQPVWSIDTALEMTAEWYKAWIEEKDLLKLTQQQIYRFLRG